MIVPILKLEFKFDTSKVDKALDEMFGSPVFSLVTNSAFYWGWVNWGRGPVHVKDAEALHFVVDGKDIFVKYVGPAAPHHMLENSLPTITMRANELPGRRLPIGRAAL